MLTTINQYCRTVFPLTVLFWLLSISAFAQLKSLRFQHITTDNGLSNNTVECIFKDRRGFMWFGTRDGLNRYDGTQVTVFRNDVQNASSISENIVNDILEDRAGTLWLATAEGLDRFVPETETFEHFSPAGRRTDVRDILEDRQGYLWLGTSRGLFQFDKKARRFVQHTPARGSLKINKVLLDRRGFLWMGTEKGLYRMEPGSRKIRHFAAEPGNPATIQSAVVRSLLEDSAGRLWVGMSEGGLALYNPARESFRTYKADPRFFTDPEGTNSLPHNDVRAIVEAEPDVLWVGTENGGLCRFDTRRNLFTTYKPNETNAASLTHDSVHSLFRDKEGTIWVGTWAGGVNYYHPSLLTFELYNRFPQAGFPGVEAITRDSDGIMWMGMVENGLYSFDPATHTFRFYPNPNIKKFEVGIYSIKELNKDTLVLAVRRGGMAFFDKRTGTFSHYLPRKNRNSIGGHELNSVLVDRHKNVWCGGWNTGLSRFNYGTKTFTNFRNEPRNPSSLSSDLIYTIYEDRKGRIWIGTDGGGLELYDPKKQGFTHYTHQKGQPESLSHNTVISLFEDSKGRFWVGTSNGLNLMDRTRGRFKAYTQKDGLPNDMINSMEEDGRGNLWLGTNKGLCMFNPDNETVKSFSVKDGLQGNEFLMNAAARDLTGNLYFSGYKGLNIFNPERLHYNRLVPPVYLTGLMIANKPVVIGSAGSPLTQHIGYTRELSLSHDQSVFSLSFAALNYVSAEKNQYAYKLEGFDDNWNYIGNKHTATYTNLDPGKYVFRVIAANNDGFWNRKGASLAIVIRPPFWETWWFRAFIVILALFAAYRIYRFKRKLELEKLEEAKREEIHQTQLLFFTNISHEFRTPLSLILGPLEKLLAERPQPSVAVYLKTMHRNAVRLMNLINELMDFRKVEAGALRLRAMQGNISLFIDEIADEFRDAAADKHISFQVLKEEFPEEVWFDRHVIEKIVLNLVHNSIKYTPEGGRITLQLLADIGRFEPGFSNQLSVKSSYQGNAYMHIRVADNGIGISQESISHLFERYYRITSNHLGSGVGLAFVKSLTALHKGNIFVSSERGKGTEILISIPCSGADYNDSERWLGQQTETQNRLESLIELPGYYDAPTAQTADKPAQERHILLVDDNKELRDFLKDALGCTYHILEAENAMEGIELARAASPDLIISDVMMPGMNGVEFCRRIKEDIETSHIPFLMLTAKTSAGSEIEGLESGADYYFTKPLSLQLLLLTLKNLFTQREILKERHLKDYHTEIKELARSEKDREFIDKLIGIIESQLPNPELDIDFLCREAAISRTKLYQKIKSITGQSIGEFVRTIRLRKAAEMMAGQDLPLTEVMYQVGIQTQSYFTKAFKKEFGKTPGQYLQEIRKL